MTSLHQKTGLDAFLSRSVNHKTLVVMHGFHAPNCLWLQRFIAARISRHDEAVIVSDRVRSRSTIQPIKLLPPEPCTPGVGLLKLSSPVPLVRKLSRPESALSPRNTLPPMDAICQSIKDCVRALCREEAASESAASSSSSVSATSKLLRANDVAVVFDAMATLLLTVPLTECVLGIRRSLEMGGSAEDRVDLVTSSPSSSSSSLASSGSKKGEDNEAFSISSSTSSTPPTIVVIDAGVCGVSSLLAFLDHASLILRIDEHPMPLHASNKADGGGSSGRGGARTGTSANTPILCGKFAVTEVSRTGKSRSYWQVYRIHAESGIVALGSIRESGTALACLPVPVSKAITAAASMKVQTQKGGGGGGIRKVNASSTSDSAPSLESSSRTSSSSDTSKDSSASGISKKLSSIESSIGSSNSTRGGEEEDRRKEEVEGGGGLVTLHPRPRTSKSSEAPLQNEASSPFAVSAAVESGATSGLSSPAPFIVFDEDDPDREPENDEEADDLDDDLDI